MKNEKYLKMLKVKNVTFPQLPVPLSHSYS